MRVHVSIARDTWNTLNSVQTVDGAITGSLESSCVYATGLAYDTQCANVRKETAGSNTAPWRFDQIKVLCFLILETDNFAAYGT